MDSKIEETSVDTDFYPDSSFKLGEAYKYGLEVGSKVKKEIKGRACGKPHDYALLAQTVFYAGNGNYVETGSLFGASALVAAITKRKFGLSGKVYCVDPFDGYYGTGNKDMSGLIPTAAIVMENARKYGVQDYIVCIPKKSVPYPQELNGVEFSMSYIDGNHWKDWPTKDFEAYGKFTTKYLMFDNYDFSHPSVADAAKFASSKPEWRICHVSSISFILQRNPKMTDPHAWAGGK